MLDIGRKDQEYRNFTMRGDKTGVKEGIILRILTVKQNKTMRHDERRLSMSVGLRKGGYLIDIKK